MIQLNDQIFLVDKLEVSLPESIAVIVDFAGKRPIIVVSYVPPREGIPINGTGDFNINTLKKKTEYVVLKCYQCQWF